VTYNINYFAFLLYMQDYNFRYAQPSAAVLLAMIFIVLTQIVLFSIVFWKFSWQNSTNKIPDEQAVCAQTAQNIVAIGPIAENPSTVSKSS
jgi:predicted permease